MIYSNRVGSARDIYCVESVPEACGVVIFGASGDLTHRKLVPSLFKLYSRGLLPRNFFLLGFARTPLSDEEFRDGLRKDIEAGGDQSHAAQLNEFLGACYYLPGNYRDQSLFFTLQNRVLKLAREHGTGGNVLFYLATPPNVYLDVVKRLSGAGLTSTQSSAGWKRVVLEKPFGHDFDSAVGLDRGLLKHLQEKQIYRIDHYLGKETVQNIFVLRFANIIFEPVWNRQYIDHVQILVGESEGVANRAGYFESTGVLRDMFQNHLMQLLALIAMEPPGALDAEHVRREKLKVLQCIRPLPAGPELAGFTVRGQYAGGTVNGQNVNAYADEKDIPDDSRTETFAALKLQIDNWRWHGVPFYLRSGKRLAQKLTQIAIVFKHVPCSLFPPLRTDEIFPDVLVLQVQPEEGGLLSLQAKRPGPKFCLGSLDMKFSYEDAFGGKIPDGYERLLLDCMLGDQTLFIQSDSIKAAWQLLDPVLQDWSRGAAASCPLHSYAAGSWGPEAAGALPGADGRQWYVA